MNSTPGEFAFDVVGGKSIGTWMTLLNAQKKDDVVEAIEALKIARSKAAAAVPKLIELSKSADKEIATAAEEALKMIGRK